MVAHTHTFQTIPLAHAIFFCSALRDLPHQPVSCSASLALIQLWLLLCSLALISGSALWLCSLALLCGSALWLSLWLSLCGSLSVALSLWLSLCGSLYVSSPFGAARVKLPLRGAATRDLAYPPHAGSASSAAGLPSTKMDRPLWRLWRHWRADGVS